MVDWEHPAHNVFLVVNHVSVTGALYTGQPELVDSKDVIVRQVTRVLASPKADADTVVAKATASGGEPPLASVTPVNAAIVEFDRCGTGVSARSRKTISAQRSGEPVSALTCVNASGRLGG